MHKNLKSFGLSKTKAKSISKSICLGCVCEYVNAEPSTVVSVCVHACK